jgi:DNA-binding IclR family transcriptional regulator
LSKAFGLLRAFTPDERVMTLSELARAAQLPKSTVHRLLARLVELDAVEHHGAGYKLSLGWIQLGAITPAASMRDVAVPHLAGLHEWSGQTVHLGVLRQFDVVYLEKLARVEAFPTLAAVGMRLPANCTAIGKALLAWEDLDDLAHFLPSPMPRLTPSSVTDVGQLIEQLRQVRAHGLAYDRCEAQPGLVCVAAPLVVDGFGVGAVSIGCHESTKLNPQIDTALRNTAARITREIRKGLADRRRSYWFPHQV